jgi:hypothetical protein
MQGIVVGVFALSMDRTPCIYKRPGRVRVVAKVMSRAGRFDWGVSGHAYAQNCGAIRDIARATNRETPCIQHRLFGAGVATY